MFVTVFLTGIALSMDAFAVAICKGLKIQKINYKQMSLIALFFGGFQAIMPFIGWVLGSRFEKYIVSVDHWIAFALLGFIGANMIKESFDKDKCDYFKDYYYYYDGKKRIKVILFPHPSGNNKKTSIT